MSDDTRDLDAREHDAVKKPPGGTNEHDESIVTAPQFFILPADFLPSLRDAMKEGNGGHPEERLFDLGKQTGLHLARALCDKNDLPHEENLKEVLGEIGMGDVGITQSQGGFTLKSDQTLEARGNGLRDEPGCHFTSGLLCGLAVQITGREFSITEVQCISQGHEHCLFELSEK